MTLAFAVLWLNRLAGAAALVNGLELLVLSRTRSRSLDDHGVWRTESLVGEFGVFRYVLGARCFAALMLGQCVVAIAVMLDGGALCVGALCLTTLLSAMRFRGNVNGGSDAMLFTVLGGLAVAQIEQASPFVREGAVLYIAAQLTLSYVRAGVAKARQRSWWTGDALTAFLALPAYGVPTWVPRQRDLLRAVGIVVIVFECVAPVAWLNPAAAATYIAVAIAFHTGTAVLFGLNRFLLAWTAAMPALWYAAHRL